MSNWHRKPFLLCSSSVRLLLYDWHHHHFGFSFCMTSHIPWRSETSTNNFSDNNSASVPSTFQTATSQWTTFLALWIFKCCDNWSFLPKALKIITNTFNFNQVLRDLKMNKTLKNHLGANAAFESLFTLMNGLLVSFHGTQCPESLI